MSDFHAKMYKVECANICHIRILFKLLWLTRRWSLYCLCTYIKCRNLYYIGYFVLLPWSSTGLWCNNQTYPQNCIVKIS
jgi:hypothetical protein